MVFSVFVFSVLKKLAPGLLNDKADIRSADGAMGYDINSMCDFCEKGEMGEKTKEVR
jgi:hypothetical protein